MSSDDESDERLQVDETAAPMEEEEEVAPAPPQTFQCSSCPKIFSSRIQRLMHEKLHMQNQGTSLNRSRLKEQTSKDIVGTSLSAATVLATSKNTLRCEKCQVYFRTSVEMSIHTCSPSKEKRLLHHKTCVNCSQDFSCQNPMSKLCLECFRKSRKRNKVFNYKERTARKEEKLKANEEIREIDGQRVKVIRVKNMDQIDEALQKRERKKQRLEAKVAPQERPPTPNSPDSPEEERTRVQFVCLFCDANFYFPNMLEAHCTQQHGSFHYCHYCFLMFPNQVNLEIHNVECPKKKRDPKMPPQTNFVFDMATRQCKLCQTTFEDLDVLLAHARMCHADLTQCDMSQFVDTGFMCCSRKFSKRTELVQHKQKSHQAVAEVSVGQVLQGPPERPSMDALSETLGSLNVISFKCPHCPMVCYSMRANSLHLKKDHNMKL